MINEYKTFTKFTLTVREDSIVRNTITFQALVSRRMSGGIEYLSPHFSGVRHLTKDEVDKGFIDYIRDTRLNVWTYPSEAEPIPVMLIEGDDYDDRAVFDTLAARMDEAMTLYHEHLIGEARKIQMQADEQYRFQVNYRQMLANGRAEREEKR